MKTETFVFNAKTPGGIAVNIEIEMDCNGWKATHLDVNNTGRYPVMSLNMYSGETLHFIRPACLFLPVKNSTVSIE